MFWDFFGRKRIAALEAANERLKGCLLREGKLHQECKWKLMEESAAVGAIRNKYDRAWGIGRYLRAKVQRLKQSLRNADVIRKRHNAQVDYIAELETDAQKAQQWIKARDAKIADLTAEVERLRGELERTSSQQGDALREALAERNAAWVARDAMIKQRDAWERCATRLRHQLREAVETVDRVVAAPYANHRGGES